MSRAITWRIGRVAAGLALAALGVLLLGWRMEAPTVEAQGPPPPNPKVIQQTRERVAGTGQTPAAAQKPSTSQAARKPANRRDPFRSLIMRPEDVGGMTLPPGKRGLVIAQVQVDGIVASPTDMIAVVTMSGRNRAYFLREGDEVYNGYVSRITRDGVVFKERAMDAFGKEYEKQVVKSLSGSGAQR